MLRPMRSALTMLEMIFVIIILGIVSSIGAEIIANVYESYIVQRAQYRANAKTELALQQIANRLRYAIPNTIYAVSSDAYIPITNISGDAEALQWVGYDADSFEAIACGSDTASCRKSGWSGFIDLNASTATSLVTPGSRPEKADGIIQNLGGSGLAGSYLYFPDGFYTQVTGGSDGTGTSSGTLTVTSVAGNTIYERYKLAWSSYALVVEGGDLKLYYNFPPLPGSLSPYSNGSSSLLLKNVISFRFKGSEGSMRIKLCVNEKIGEGTDAIVASCKEKVVF